MRKVLFRIYMIYLNPALDFRVRLFNVLAIGGTLVSLAVSILGLLNDSGFINIAASFLSMALSFTLLTVSRRTGHYQLCYMVTIFVIFMGLFPVFFFSAGGYHSGMPAFFVFAVAFTMFMLEGKVAILFSVAETLLYMAICIIAYLYPQTVNPFEAEQGVLIDIIIAFVSVNVVLGVCMFLHFRLYNEQQRTLDKQNRKLDEQNTVLEQVNRAKTEFIANTSHEMRTPLTVMSVNVQLVMRLLERMSDTAKDTEAAELLDDVQSEIMRLARMVGGLLTLTSISENTEKRKIELDTLLQSTGETLRPLLSKRGNTLQTKVDEGLEVFGAADLLSQVVINLIQNAHNHTENDAIKLSAVCDGRVITITVSDNGSGVAPDMIPHIFQRGVSGGGGTGLGLFICKTVVESHGGEIWIESEQCELGGTCGKGTSVHFTIPVYEGQYGGDTV